MNWAGNNSFHSGNTYMEGGVWSEKERGREGMTKKLRKLE